MLLQQVPKNTSKNTSSYSYPELTMNTYTPDTTGQYSSLLTDSNKFWNIG